MPREATIVTRPTREQLTDRQKVDYREYKQRLVDWLRSMGKDPEMASGYATATTKQTSAKVDQAYRWLWEECGRYTKQFEPDDADDYLDHLIFAETDYSQEHYLSVQKCLKRLLRYRLYQNHIQEEWDPKHTFKQPGTSNPRDYLSREERSRLREAALQHGSIPNYHSVSPEERARWKAYLAQRFEKPIDTISKDDWERANGWKIPSLVWATLDTGLRPVEVERATVAWVDVENGVLRIPKEDSSKNRDNWIVGLTDRTTDALERWLVEREQYDRYEDRDELWLTRHGNPYRSGSLNGVLGRLLELAEIDREDISWYSIRHSVGTYMVREEDLAAAQAQLRHKTPETTMRYDQAPVEDRREALNRMG